MPSAAFADVASDRAALLAGVHEIVAPGEAGSVSILADNGFAVVAGKANNALVPVVGAGSYGKGRAVAFGSWTYLRKDVFSGADTGRLLTNSIRWAAHGKAKPCVGVLESWSEFADYLKARGFSVVLLSENSGAAMLDKLDVVVGCLTFVPETARPAYRAFAKRGGGLVLTETGWSWYPLPTLAGNEVLTGSGVLFSGVQVPPTVRDRFTTATPLPDTLNVETALRQITRGKPKTDKSRQALTTLSDALYCLPPTDTTLLPRLTKLAASARTDFADMTAHPVTADAPLDRLALSLQVRQALTLPPEKIRPNPAATAFPGAVPKGAPRETRTVTLRAHRGGWESTGLYAAPGELVTVTVPREAAGKGFQVRIGAHTDPIWHLDTWKRAPDISRVYPIQSGVTRAANAFGGTIFIAVPESAKLDTLRITIANAVAQPHFVRGRTPRAEWRTLRNAPAPWAELEGEHCVLSLPSSVVRDLENPEELMSYWDAVILQAKTLYADPRPARERYCPDVQIRYGYMHAGYPIMTLLDVEKTFVDLPTLHSEVGKVWGFYHEAGHNFQRDDWTWDGASEVTNNLFTLYAGEVFNEPYRGGDYGGSHPFAPAERAKRMVSFFREGATFEKWKRDPFLALIIFVELRREFGWEPFTKVFAEYAKLPASERPKTDGEKRDQFLVRFSRTVGKNLGPLFTAWAIPTSESARKSLADLPVWMPDELKPYLAEQGGK